MQIFAYKLLSVVLQALAIYKTLSTEPQVPSTESDAETPHTQLDSGRESMDSALSASDKTAATGEQTVSKSADGVWPHLQFFLEQLNICLRDRQSAFSKNVCFSLLLQLSNWCT